MQPTRTRTNNGASTALATTPSAPPLAETKPNDRVNWSKVAEKYARDVVDGKVPAGPYVVLAAKRHIDDLVRQDSSFEFPYHYDAAVANRVCRFIETLPHTKGRWAAGRERICLQPWQCFLVCGLFGWLRNEDLLRRFRKAYWEIPRKNGKSLLAAAIGLYMTMHDNEYGAEVYSGATTEKQAWEVFRPARQMALKTPLLLSHFGVEVWAKTIVRPRDGSKFEPLIGNPGDGSSPSCAIVDEFHEHDTPALYDTMETGMGAREQPLMLVITTAGYNIAGPCHELNGEVRKVLNGGLRDETVFGCIFGIGEKDDWADPSVLIKANPNYNVSVDGEFLQSQQRAAMANPIHQTKFKTKHLNVWCSVMKGWMNMQLWHAAADPMLDEDELIGQEGVKCWESFDLASKSDLCTEQKLYRKIINDQEHFYLFGRYWLPEEAVEAESQNQSIYRKWVKMGLLTQTDGATVDFKEVTAQLVADARKINPEEIVYDPFNATQVASDLIDEGVKNVVEFLQLPHNFAVPMDEVLTALKDGRFHHDGNEITTWCVSNTVARPAKKGLFSPMKEKEHQKIDGAVAFLMAMGRAIAVREKERDYQMLVL